MSERSPEELALLEAAREAWGPSEVTLPSSSKVHERLADKPWLGHSPPPARRFGYVAVVTLAAVVVGTMGLVAVRGGAPARPAVVETHAVAAAPVTAPAAPEPYVTPTIAIESLPNAPPAPVTRAAPEARPAKKMPEPAPAAEPPAVTTAEANTLADELLLIRAAQGALRDGAPDRALVSLGSHASRFPHGVLRDERMVLRALALCARGEVAAARDVRSELERTSPGSSHLQRLATSCAR